MLSFLLRPARRSRTQADSRSPFSSSSPEAARRDPPDERSRLLRQDQDHPTDGKSTSDTDSEDDDDADPNLANEEMESDNEDGIRDETPLLPIFSAAHLGTKQSSKRTPKLMQLQFS